MLRSLIRQGAQDGSFDRELGATSPRSRAFFAKLKRALVTGYFVEEGRSGKIDTVAVPGYVFWPDDRHSGIQPVGFGLFRAIDGGYELWLAGPRSRRARRRPRPRAAGGAVRDAAGPEDLDRSRPARVALRRRAAAPARRFRLRLGRRYAAPALVPAHRRAGRPRLARARRRRRAQRAKLAAFNNSSRDAAGGRGRACRHAGFARRCVERPGRRARALQRGAA